MTDIILLHFSDLFNYITKIYFFTINRHINLSVLLKSTTLPMLTTPSTTLNPSHLRGGGHIELTLIMNLEVAWQV